MSTRSTLADLSPPRPVSRLWVISELKYEDLSQSASHPLADSHVLHEHVFSRFLSSA